MKTQASISQRFRTLSFLLWLAVSFLSIGNLAAQPIQVNVTVLQPVTPFLPQLATEIQDGVYGRAGQSLSDKLVITVTNTGQTPRNLKLFARIERLSPSPAAVYLRPDFQPSKPIVIGGNQMLQLNRDLIEDAFGNFSRRSLIFENLDLDQLRNNQVNYKLPEGMYRICVTAYDYDQRGQSAPLSAIGTGCAVFNICYTASAPQFTMPVSTLMGMGSDMVTFTPTSPQIRFAWTPPATTCGLPLRGLNYDLEIREIFSGQTVNDAKNNPFVFRQQMIPSTMFILDTMKYPNVFKKGKQYVIRVKANIQKNATDPVEIANQGYSELAALEYNPKSAIVGRITLPPGINATVTSGTIANTCEGVAPVTSTVISTADITNKDIRVGNFIMHVNNASSAGGNAFKGSGTIVWSPYGRPVKLRVAFDNITVNDKSELLNGEVVTTTDNTIPEWMSLKTPGALDQLTSINSSTIQPMLTRVNKAANQIHKITGDDPVDFPLGLDNQKFGGSVSSTFAITGITFTATGTDMRILFAMNIADAVDVNPWLSLAGTGFCIEPDKISWDKGTVYLPNDRKIKMGGGYVLNFKGAQFTGPAAIDLDNTTYLKWNEDGFEKIFVNAEFAFSKDALVAVDADRNIVADTVKLNAKFDFSDWNDWIANLSFNRDFELKALHGFTIKSGSGFFYDHSNKRNVPELQSPSGFPTGYAAKGGTVDKTFQGFYMPSLQMMLPKDFVASSSAAFDVTNMIIDDAGVTARIFVRDIVKKDDNASLGGWGFTIDSIKIPIVRNNIYEQMGMSGSIWLPISETGLGYECLLNKSEKEGEGYGYAFNIKPKDQMDMDMWKATLSISDDSGFWIEKQPGKDLSVMAKLTGGISIMLDASIASIPVNASIPLLGVKNLTVSNKDGFSMEMESMTLGSVPLKKGNKETSFLTEDEDPLWQYAYRTGGPNAPAYPAYPAMADAPWAGDDNNGAVGGFGVTIDNFELKQPAGGKIGLFFDLSLDLGFSDAATLSGGTNLGVVAAYKMVGTKPKVSFDGVQVDRVWLDGKFGPVGLRGSVDFWSNNPTYGDGVHGALAADFIVGSFDADVYFGAKGSVKYGGVGAKFFIATGIPVFGGLTLNGFGGGYYSNMKTETIDQNKVLNAGPADKLNIVPQSGGSLFSAMLIVAYANPTIVNASLTVNIETKNGGLSKLILNGDGHIMTIPGNYKDGFVNASVKMTMDIAESIFDAEILADADFGIGKINIPVWMHGGGRGSASKYYLWVGRPDRTDNEKVKAEFGFGEEGDVLYAKLTATAYFCMGVGAGSLPAFPGLPSSITQFLDGSKGNQVSKPGGATSPEANAKAITDFLSDPNNVNGGFMFGAAVEAKLGLDFFIFYAKAKGMIGFDMAMVETKPGSTGACSVNGAIGYKGYYAIGQMYAYFGMAVGVHLGVGDLDFVSLQLGAYLRGGLPNPTWGEGKLRITGSIVGIFDFDADVAFDFGTKCYPEYDPLAHLELISEVSPAEMTIFEYPYVVYNVPVQADKNIHLVDNHGNKITDGIVSYPNPPDETHTQPYQRYYVFKHEFTQMSATGNSGDRYPVDIIYTNNNYVATYNKQEEFAPQTEYSFKATVTAYQYMPDKSLKKVLSQEKVVKFKTKIAGSELSKEQMDYTYPIDGQRYFLKKEFGGQGFIKLNQAPREERVPMNNPAFVRTVQFVPDNGTDTVSTNFSWVASSIKIDFAIPQELKPGTGYQMRLLLVPANAEQQMEKELETKQTQITPTVKKMGDLVAHNQTVKNAFDNTGNGASSWTGIQPTKNLQLIATEQSVKQKASAAFGVKIFSVDMRTSMYNTFQEKMAGHNLAVTKTAGSHISFKFQLNEGFDGFEIKKFNLGYGTGDKRSIEYAPLLNMAIPPNFTLKELSDASSASLNMKYTKLEKGNDAWALFNIYRYGRASSPDLDGVRIVWDGDNGNNAVITRFSMPSFVEFYQTGNNIPAPYVFSPLPFFPGLILGLAQNNHVNETEEPLTYYASASGGPSAVNVYDANYKDAVGIANAPAGVPSAGNIKKTLAEVPTQTTITRMPESYITMAGSKSASGSFDLSEKTSGVYTINTVSDAAGMQSYQAGGLNSSVNTPGVVLKSSLNLNWRRDEYFNADYNLIRTGAKKYLDIVSEAGVALENFEATLDAVPTAVKISGTTRTQLITNMKKNLFNEYKTLAVNPFYQSRFEITNYKYLFPGEDTKADILRATMYSILFNQAGSFERFPSVTGREYKLKYSNPFKVSESGISGKFNYQK